MGRRELFIALAFLVVGVVAYQLTAPAKPASSRSSIGDLMTSFRRGIRGNPGRASFTHRGLIDAPRAITELRPPPVNTLILIGEPRADVAFELTVQSMAADDAAARTAAEGVRLVQDAFGQVLALRVQHPPQARSTTAMTLRVPARLAVRLEGVRRTTVSQVGAIHLEGLVGDAQLSGIAGAVSGSHRNGSLALDGAGSVTLTLTGSRASLTGVRGATSVTGRGGEVRITNPSGPVDVNGTDLDVAIAGASGRVRIDGSNGDVVLDRPAAETEINGRRLEVTITLAAAVPVTVVTSERPLTLLLDGPPAVTIDAAASDGATIDATAFALTADTIDRGQRLQHRFGEEARVALRAERGSIVIGRVK